MDIANNNMKITFYDAGFLANGFKNKFLRIEIFRMWIIANPHMCRYYEECRYKSIKLFYYLSER